MPGILAASYKDVSHLYTEIIRQKNVKRIA